VVLGFLLVLILSAAAIVVSSIVSDVDADYRANHPSPAEELQLAREFCPSTSNGAVACDESEMEIVLRHLDKISPSAPEYSDATKLRSLIQAFRVKVESARRKQEAEHDRLIHQSNVSIAGDSNAHEICEFFLERRIALVEGGPTLEVEHSNFSVEAGDPNVVIRYARAPPDAVNSHPPETQDGRR